jgi:adenine-specific DNA-methyltransferase
MPTLDWIGKKAVVNHHRDVPYRLIHCDKDKSVGDPDAGNLLVQGDNLEALKALLPYYAGKVKCIYIDPPYNTGSEGWVYNDNVNSPEIRAWLGATVGKEAEDLSRHDKWLCMMYPRLRLLKEFLTEDGAVFISCDDNEQDHLRAVCDAIFGRRSFLCTIVWQSKDTPGNNSSGIAEMHSYLIVYKKGEAHKVALLERSEDQIENYTNQDSDRRGDWLGSPLTRAEHRDRDYYALTNKAGREVYPPPGSSWRRPPAVMKRLAADDRIWWGKDGNASFPMEKKFLEEAKEGVVQRTWWPYEYAGSTRNASAELKDIFEGKKPFETPKPSILIKRILDMFGDDEMIVMDAFAGSGTTAHAVLEKNLEDMGRRRFLLIEMDSRIAEEVTRERLSRLIVGYTSKKRRTHTLEEVPVTLRNLSKAPEIAERMKREAQARAGEFESISVEFDEGTLRLVAQRAASEKSEGLGSGFRFCTLGAPLFDAYGNVSPAVTFLDLAAHVFFCETGSPIPRRADGSSTLIGTFQGRAVYLLHSAEAIGVASANAGNVLTATVLENLPLPEPAFAGPRVVYAEGCTVPDDRLSRLGVTFKQIPYQIEGL